MDWKAPRTNWILAVTMMFALVLGLPTLTAQQDAPPTGQDDLKAKVAELSAMSSEARRAELRKLSPAERRGLWFELKRSRALQDRGPGQNFSEYRRPRPPADAGTAAQQAPPVARLTGSIVYDDGVVTTSFGGGSIVGNRFDTANGNALLTSGTISTVVGVVVPGAAFTTSSAGFVIEGPQTGGGGAMALFSTFTGATGTQDTVVFSGLGVGYPGNSFYVLFGDFANSYIPAFGTGTTQSQGHHGVVGYTGGMGPNITSTFNFGDTLNALVRVTGNVLPVELMSFEVDGQ